MPKLFDSLTGQNSIRKVSKVQKSSILYSEDPVLKEEHPTQSETPYTWVPLSLLAYHPIPSLFELVVSILRAPR